MKKSVLSIEKTPPEVFQELSSAKGNTLIMGVLNVTPDSFSDGGLFFDGKTALDHGLRMAEEGADIIDIGGESTRPFSEPISIQEEIERVVPVIEALSSRVDAMLSIDTTKSEVAREAVRAGARLINDISAMRFDENMGVVTAELDVPVVLMHMKGSPRTMQIKPYYRDVMAEIKEFFQERMDYAVSCGIARDHVILDPGIGFGKTFDHNLQILHRFSDFLTLDRPLLLGTSRKAFIGKITGKEQALERDIGTAATVAIGVYNGARIIRTHNVEIARQTVAVVDAIKQETTDHS